MPPGKHTLQLETGSAYDLRITWIGVDHQPVDISSAGPAGVEYYPMMFFNENFDIDIAGLTMLLAQHNGRIEVTLASGIIDIVLTSVETAIFQLLASNFYQLDLYPFTKAAVAKSGTYSSAAVDVDSGSGHGRITANGGGAPFGGVLAGDALSIVQGDQTGGDSNIGIYQVTAVNAAKTIIDVLGTINGIDSATDASLEFHMIDEVLTEGHTMGDGENPRHVLAGLTPLMTGIHFDVHDGQFRSVIHPLPRGSNFFNSFLTVGDFFIIAGTTTDSGSFNGVYTFDRQDDGSDSIWTDRFVDSNAAGVGGGDETLNDTTEAAGSITLFLPNFDVTFYQNTTYNASLFTCAVDVDDGSSRSTLTASGGTDFSTKFNAGDYIRILNSENGHDGLYQVFTAVGAVLTLTDTLPGTDNTDDETICVLQATGIIKNRVAVGKEFNRYFFVVEDSDGFGGASIDDVIPGAFDGIQGNDEIAFGTIIEISGGDNLEDQWYQVEAADQINRASFKTTIPLVRTAAAIAAGWTGGFDSNATINIMTIDNEAIIRLMKGSVNFGKRVTGTEA